MRERNVTHYLETEQDIRDAYLSGANAAKRGFARIPSFFERYAKMYDAWLRGYDHYKFTHQGSTKK
jgi:hypothetical protein